jgi:hypothetical protein
MSTSKGIPGLQRVDHIGKTVPDLAQASRFFIDVLAANICTPLDLFGVMKIGRSSKSVAITEGISTIYH